jgi:hypothetical protein
MDPWESKSFGGTVGRRTDSVTVRLEPRLRYLADLAARIQRRTLSAFIEDAISNSLGMMILKDSDPTKMHSLKDANELWDVFEPDRFVKLALYRPELLNHHEQILWKLIRETDVVWRMYWDNGEYHRTSIDEDHVLWRELRAYWETFNKIARGEKPTSELPTKSAFNEGE